MFSRLKVSKYSHMISKSCIITQSYSQNRALHVFLRTKDLARKTNYLECFSSSSINNTSFVRFSSTNFTPVIPVQEELPLIPDAPIIPPEITGVIGEASLQSFGLGSYFTPIGWIQHGLYTMHTTCGLPWWTTIVIGTIVLRCATSPLFLTMQRHLALRNVHKKELSYFDRKRKEASENNDQFRVNLYMQKQEVFFAKNGMLTTMKMGIYSAIQGVCFASFFLAINKMANVPLPSLKEGGFAWFVDLTVADPYYILPVITSMSTALYLYLTPTPAAVATVNMENLQKLKYVFPVIGLIIMIYLKSASLFYVITSTWLTFLFQALLRVPKVRAWCNIAPIVKHQPHEVGGALKDVNVSILESIKNGWKSMKKNRGQRAAESADRKQFQTAGRGPLIKTYKYDPTKVTMHKRN